MPYVSPLASRPTLPLVAFATLSIAAFGYAHQPPAAAGPSRIAINDNTTPVGRVADGVLTIRLVAGEGEWHPDRENERGVVVEAFGEEWKPLQIPGPLIRVAEGTDVRATIRNSLAHALVMHGLSSRSAERASDTLHIAANATREVRFQAGAAGTYFYWAAPNADPDLSRRQGKSTTLSGAFIVEPRGAARRADRIFVMSLWSDLAIEQVGIPARNRIVINGKAWPNTERLSYSVGDTVRLRMINAGAAVHPMHLHGFYFNVDSRGDERSDSLFPPNGSKRMVVTERLVPGRTFSLTWVPTRPGNWLFHCHDNSHITPNTPIAEGAEPPTVADHSNHALTMMGGPVMGIVVNGRSSEPPVANTDERRHLRLVARVAPGSSNDEPAYGYTLQEGGRTVETSTSRLIPGPTLVLKRGQPVSITVVNELQEPTAVHWHGIELESYFDGVAGFSGQAGKISPAIAPRDSFEARFTPPRSGTFIYHTHINEVRQQRAGLSGALVVVDDPAQYDPATDLVMLLTTPRLNNEQLQAVYLNGSPTPAALDLRVNTRYRLRIINVHTFRPSMIVRIWQDSTLLTWRALAKDGMPLPNEMATVRRATQQLGNGETYDVEFTPTQPGALRLDVTSAVNQLLVRMPLNVR